MPVEIHWGDYGEADVHWAKSKGKEYGEQFAKAVNLRLREIYNCWYACFKAGLQKVKQEPVKVKAFLDEVA